MALTPRPKWVESKTPWTEGDPPPLMDMMRSEVDVDRFHNREDQSPEAMAQAITELTATVGALNGRLAAVEEGTAGVVHAAKDLGTNMVKMGDALTKRVKDLEGDADRASTDAAEARAEAASARAEASSARAALVAERNARQKTVRLTIVGAVVLTAAMIGLVFMAPKLTASPAKSPAPVLYSPGSSTN